MKRAIFLALLLSLPIGWAAEPPMKTGDVSFLGRECRGCKYQLRQGYLVKVIHPQEGTWDISDEVMATINSDIVKVDPRLHRTRWR